MKKQSVKSVTDQEVEEAKRGLPAGTRFGERMKALRQRDHFLTKAELDGELSKEVERPGELSFEWNGREWNLIAVS